MTRAAGVTQKQLEQKFLALMAALEGAQDPDVGQQLTFKHTPLWRLDLAQNGCKYRLCQPTQTSRVWITRRGQIWLDLGDTKTRAAAIMEAFAEGVRHVNDLINVRELKEERNA